MARRRSRRRPPPHRWAWADFRQSAAHGAGAAQCRAAGLRSAAAGQGRPVAPEHRCRGRCRRTDAETGARRSAAMSAAGGRDFDVVIVGAGVIGTVMAGLLWARKLSAAGRVAILADRFAGAVPPDADWVLRVFALSRASERLLRA